MQRQMTPPSRRGLVRSISYRVLVAVVINPGRRILVWLAVQRFPNAESSLLTMVLSWNPEYIHGMFEYVTRPGELPISFGRVRVLPGLMTE